jgi:hypothetical protein
MEKDEFIKKMKAQFNELNFRYSTERDKIEAKAQHLSADARIAVEDELKKASTAAQRDERKDRRP